MKIIIKSSLFLLILFAINNARAEYYLGCAVPTCNNACESTYYCNPCAYQYEYTCQMPTRVEIRSSAPYRHSHEAVGVAEYKWIDP